MQMMMAMEVLTMATLSSPKAITLRIKPEIHAAIINLALQKQMSVNSLIEQQLGALVRETDEKKRYDAYTLLGQDAEMCNVEYAIHAQSEVIFGEEMKFRSGSH